MRVLPRPGTKLRLYTASIFWVFFALSGAATSSDKIPAAKRLIVSLYPDLATMDTSLIIRDGTPLKSPESLNLFTIEVRSRRDHEEPNDLCSPARLYAQFKFPSGIVDGRIFELSMEGSIVNHNRRRALSKLVDSHPEWSDDEVLKALAEAGAPFGPAQKQQLMARLPIKQLEPLLGSIRIISAEFNLRSKDQLDAHLPAAQMVWYVVLKAHRPGLKDLNYVMSLEPFDGQLLWLLRTSWPPPASHATRS